MRRSPDVRGGLLAVFVFLAPIGAFAQTTTTLGAAAPVRLGRVGLTPAISFETGLESNPRNSATDPHADTFVSVASSLAAAFNLNRLEVGTSVAVPYLRYADTPTMGQDGVTGRLDLKLPLTRLTLNASGAYANTTQKLSLEIDTPVQRTTRTVAAGLALELTAHMALDVSAEQQQSGYGNDVLGGVELGQALSQRQQSARIGLRRSVTPLTDVVGVIEARRDRFDNDRTRDADSQRVTIGIQSTALLHGSAAVGYVSFSPLSSALVPFKGLIAQAELQYPLFKTTQVSLQLSRDVAFSYQPIAPYYVSTSATLAVIQPIALGLIARVSAGIQRADYRVLASDSGGAVSPEYTGHSYTVGLGHPIGRHLVLGVAAGSTDRRADIAALSYANRRIGVTLAVTY